MCGDGANDCGALLSSDIGISISHKRNQNKITAHFYSNDDSIKCLVTILRNGRACYENSVIIFKFMILNGIIQNCSILLFFSIGSSDFSTYQYLFQDCFTVLISCLLASKYFNFKNRTGADPNLKNHSLKGRMFGKNFLLSVIGQSIIQTSFQTAFFSFFVLKRVNYCKGLSYGFLKIEDVDFQYDVSIQGSVNFF